ncbi:hypothetical protein G647_06758 [Cladophialophora carrionii CBS 160.54]|uniref:Uncharacterized protein n=1 Tax=Cladophialophora carrionii CBS 160.54 TaxID=1279043 RepID=V9D9N4_9EURO|nr:uncharacterized protein G647_06758 [Cladophialophora carrionii CBS 160.54]ETI22682.1 hypothetical protein G647_06758 [Cladophialophora carrionii CBS 160.54]
MSAPSPTTLSRSSSFAPGSHRRSHPNLQHLSLAPLTPKYPIDPADYSAYFDPSTSELHTSASISHVASLPSPGGILSRSGSAANSRVQSRANSRTRLNNRKKNKSFVTIQAPLPLTEGTVGNLTAAAAAPYGALTSEGLGHKSISVEEKERRLSSLSSHPTQSASNYTGHHPLHKSDSSWLIQTGLTLTEGSRESKGQSWISKRDSSTSLATPLEERPSMAMTGMRSGRNTPGNLSRRGSFQEKRRSRRSLAMTPTVPSTTPMLEMDAPPDWADEQSQAEIAAQYHEDFGDDFSDDDADDDPYGVLDFEGQFDSEDEDELRRSIKGYRLGAWMDGLVDVFLRLEDDFPGSQLEATKAVREKGEGKDQNDSPAASASSGAPKDADLQAGQSVRFDDSVEPPPERPKTVWDDVAWFGRMVARTVRS